MKNIGYSKIFKLKRFSIGIINDRYSPFTILLQYNNKGDHFGWNFELTLFKINFYICLDDIRHWNYAEDRPYRLDEKEDE
ncbi:MAG: hypothetical protein M0R17_03095 [Candidatus Omnitrophica bacterium]|jgi:hypothetical protein|nr:hypothetical protein [Candidatus Omnitrophota bacterium]